MIFGEVPTGEAAGAILVHSLKAKGLAFKKGRRLSKADLAKLNKAGVGRIVVARLEADEVHEDEAATALAAAICGHGLTASESFTGRCNLMVQTRGLLVAERDRIDALNLVDEAVTLATLPPCDLVEPRQMAATIKIIPFAITRHVLEACLAVIGRGEPLLSVAALMARKVGLLQTELPGTKASLLDKTRDVANQRLAMLDCAPAVERRCPHEQAPVTAALATLVREDCEIILMSGASAIVDRRDVLPSALTAAGGSVDHFGMPVDPGNLILLGKLEDRPVVGLPGCARSPKLNGFDWVLRRLVAGLEVTPEEVMRMGTGGLLKEIASRPLPRAEAVERAEGPPRAPRIAAVVLAAGQSRRMGKRNKLLIPVDGTPMVTRVADCLLSSQAAPLAVVTGHDYAAVEAALPEGRFTLTHNPDFASGLSSSLKRGLAALPEDIDGVLVCLGDMPRLSPKAVDRLIAAFDPLEGRAICVPTWQGKRGNPVLFAKRFFAEMQEVAGDVGARALIGEHAEAVCEVPMDDDAVLVDVDTPEALAALGA
ncbi:molybdopterin-binding/glycosyltransferase family 2 protein [Pelagibius sp.]|uniref:molybdopterin-binding/glycosyltransferase family 2 protein n=1 Tax=Pelagibius sp. TaxID=1931238 RepID=UPI00260CE4D7|nr:molybdopterin-binding/glycosyltransferase family 2 protein [Pelagibius sp.]